jgi:hypothetical protein
MGYVPFGHMLPWIFPKHMAFKNIVYNVYCILITSIRDGQGYTILLVRIRCLCVEKMGYVSVVHLLPWIFHKHMAFKNIVYSFH